MNLTPRDLWDLNLLSYRNAIAQAQAHGDAMKVVELARARRGLVERGPEADA